MKEFSIIMPVYNSEKTIKRAIESIIEQTVQAKYELIIINDGSTDNTEKICDEFIKKYEWIKYKKISNMGVSNARNLGIEISNSKYIVFIDSDDFLERNALEVMLKKINENDTDLLITGYRRINESNNRLICKKIDNCTYLKKEFYKLIPKAQNNNLFNQLWNKVYKADVIKENSIKFDPSISLGEDYRFILQYLQCINKITVIEELLYNYINSTNGLNCKYRADRLDINLENVKLLEQFYLDNNFKTDYIKSKFLKTCLSGISNICKNNNKEERRKKLKNFIENEEIQKSLKYNYSGKEKILAKIISVKKIYILELEGFFLNVYDKIYKKFKLGY